MTAQPEPLFHPSLAGALRRSGEQAAIEAADAIKRQAQEIERLRAERQGLLVFAKHVVQLYDDESWPLENDIDIEMGRAAIDRAREGK
jgi:hypothetical protein